MAMLLGNNPKYPIVASDISPEAIEAAKKGKGFVKDIEKELGVDTGIFKKISNDSS
jgi:methylase of polypeptide subunit release factors